MEVAESSLALSARCSSVPSALLLTDVALSCTFEASRMKHTSKQLLEIRLEVVTTLQSLKTNLDMARVVGVDAETTKLSITLVEKAARRIMAAVRQLGAALRDAGHRARQCGANARTVAAFAVGRAAKEEEEAEEEARQALALEGPAPLERPATGEREPAPQSQPQPRSPGVSPPQAEENAEPKVVSGPSRHSALLESRLQNDRLLRQLNADLREQQRRARGHLSAPRGAVSTALAGISADARSQAFEMAAEVLSLGVEGALSALAAADGAPAVLAPHLGFLKVSGSSLAMPLDLRAQALRVAGLLHAEALEQALEKAKRQIVSSMGVPTAERAPVKAAVETFFEEAAADLPSALAT